MNKPKSLPTLVVTADRESRVITHVAVEVAGDKPIGLGKLNNNWYRNPTLTSKILWFFLEFPNTRIRSKAIAEAFKIDAPKASSVIQALATKLPGLLIKQSGRFDEYSLTVKEIKWNDPSGYF